MSNLQRDWPLFLLLALAAGYLAYLYQTRYMPCETPITFYVLRMDDKFGLSVGEVRNDLDEAARVWNNAIGRNIFSYKEGGDVPVLFSYQERPDDTREEHKEGRYISDEKGQRIIIYSFEDRENLHRIVAHELGHALELEHVNTEDSIMYSINKGEDLRLSAEDKAELDRVCNEPHDLKAFIELALERVLG
jgi:hypothetical protein